MEKLLSSQGQPIRLLLVDDEVGFVTVLTKRMTKRGLQVMHAHGGTEALQVLRKHEFDVAVLDLKMEDMDGLETLRILKKMDPHLLVIMLTGHGSADSAAEGLRLGASDYLTKPCVLEELLEKIRSAIHGRDGGEP